MSTEKHLWGYFVPEGARFLLLGSFSANAEKDYDWFYSTKRNQFWPILEKIYGVKLPTVGEKQALFTRIRMAVTDTLISAKRKKNDNADTSLSDYVFNTQVITEILRENNIEIIYFSSKFAEKLFRKMKLPITGIKLVILPSPSPRNARMSLAAKTAGYKQVLPQIYGSSR